MTFVAGKNRVPKPAHGNTQVRRLFMRRVVYCRRSSQLTRPRPPAGSQLTAHSSQAPAHRLTAHGSQLTGPRPPTGSRLTAHRARPPGRLSRVGGPVSCDLCAVSLTREP